MSITTGASLAPHIFLDAARNGPGGVAQSRIGRQRIDNGFYFGNLGRRKAAQLGVLPNCSLAFSEVDAECLVVDNVGMVPLYLAGEFGQRTIGSRRCVFELRAIHGAHARQVALDYIAFHWSYSVVIRTDAKSFVRRT